VSEASEVASPKKILIVRLGAMGDIIHALPAAMYLKTVFPKAKIGWAVERRWSELLEWKFSAAPFPDLVHKLDLRGWRKRWPESGTRREIVSALRQLRAEKYDVAVDFQGAMKSALIALLSGTPQRFGFAEAWEKPASLFYTNPIDVRARHVVRQNLDLAAAVTGSTEAENIVGSFFEWAPSDLRVDRWASGEIRQLGLDSGFAILNPGAGWGAKQWPVERYAEVARHLGAEGIRSLVNYGPGEEELAKHVEHSSGGHAVARSFTISQLIAVTRRASLFIGGDTGPMHLAAFLNVPVVAIFGPTNPARTGPYGTKSIVLRDARSITSHKRQREIGAGLRNITTEQVFVAARELLNTKDHGVRA
jgi:heptosyltransferase-1